MSDRHRDWGTPLCSMHILQMESDGKRLLWNSAASLYGSIRTLLEVRWLLSKQARHDVGTNRAFAAPARDVIPTDFAAKMAIVEVSTAPFEVLRGD